jgi:hypothetical protein
MAQRITLLGCIDCVISGNTHDLTLISCTGITGAVSMSEQTWLENGRIIGNRWNELNYLNASALAPADINGTEGRYFDVDTSGGDVYVLLDADALEGESMEFNFSAVGNDFIIATTDNTGTFIGNALPYTFTPLQWESLTLGFKDGNIRII